MTRARNWSVDSVANRGFAQIPARGRARIAVELELPFAIANPAGPAVAPITQALGAPKLSPSGTGVVPGEMRSSSPMGTARTMRRKGEAAGYPACASPLLGTLATTIAARGESGRSAISRNVASSSGVLTFQWALKLRIRAPLQD